MRLLNGPWMTLVLLAPLIAVIGMAVLQVPAIDRARASTPSTSLETPAPQERGNLKTEWWDDRTQAKSTSPQLNDRFKDTTLADANRGLNSARQTSPSAPASLGTNADDLFQSFRQARPPQPSTVPRHPIDAFERDTARLNANRDRAAPTIPAAYTSDSVRSRIGVAHAGGIREITTVNESQFNTRIDPIASSRAFARPAPAKLPTAATARPMNSGRSLPPQRLTWRGAIARLNELGISEYRLEPGQRSHEFLFSCRYTPADSPRLTRLFMAEAVEPLRAVEKVIAQVEQWKQLR